MYVDALMSGWIVSEHDVQSRIGLSPAHRSFCHSSSPVTPAAGISGLEAMNVGAKSRVSTKLATLLATTTSSPRPTSLHSDGSNHTEKNAPVRIVARAKPSTAHRDSGPAIVAECAWFFADQPCGGPMPTCPLATDAVQRSTQLYAPSIPPSVPDRLRRWNSPAESGQGYGRRTGETRREATEIEEERHTGSPREQRIG